jgi:tetratricopeptide (TPR) repeat protein
MRDALHAQRGGAAATAASLYRQVLAVDPANFDAMHMLGLVEYERGDHEIALALIRRAIELRPELGAPRHNLRLLESMPSLEAEICREVLPRLLARVDAAFAVGTLASAPCVHIVLPDVPAELDRVAVEQFVAACAGARIAIWSGSPEDGGVAPARMLTAEDRPSSGVLVLLATDRPLARWLAAGQVERVLLLVTREAPCTIIDRVDELAALGYSRPGLLCAMRELALRLRLPATAALTQREALPCVDA